MNKIFRFFSLFLVLCAASFNSMHAGRTGQSAQEMRLARCNVAKQASIQSLAQVTTAPASSSRPVHISPALKCAVVALALGLVACPIEAACAHNGTVAAAPRKPAVCQSKMPYSAMCCEAGTNATVSGNIPRDTAGEPSALPSISFITGNTKKCEELQRVIPTITCVDYDLPEIQELDPHAIIEAKLAEAISKNNATSPKSLLCVEDSSLYFDSMRNVETGQQALPGPFIKWFFKAFGTKGLYAKAADKNGNSGRAQSTSIIGCVRGSGEIFFVEGSVNGTIVKPRGTRGFICDPVFQPDGSEKTLAEMRDEEREPVSMRSIAAKKLKEKLSQKQ